MKYGQVYSAGYGNPDNHLKYLKCEDKGAYYNLYFAAAPGLGDAYFTISRNAARLHKVYVEEGADFGPYAVQKAAGTTNSILVLREGRLADPWHVNIRVVRAFEALANKVFTLQWSWPYEFPGDPAGVTTAWSLTGLTYALTDRVQDALTRGRLYYDLVVTGGNVAVTVHNSTATLATGSGAFPGTIALTGTLAGSVDVGAAAATSTDNPFYVRWPKKADIKRNVTDPPTTIVATVYFNGTDTGRYTEPAALAAGTYYYRIQPTSDTDDLGDVSTSASDTIAGAPEPPTDLAYSSGNASATVLSFTRSATAGATYRLYLRLIGAAFIDLSNIQATAAAGTPGTTGTITLPAITGYAGTVQAVLRAVNAGTEEKGLLGVDLEYDAAGNYVVARPNTPQIDTANRSVTSGRQLSIPGIYPMLNAAGVATTLQLFKRTPAGSYNYASPDATAALGSLDTANNIKRATITYTFASNGYYYVTLKAATASGVQSADPADEILVYVSDVNAAAPTLEIFSSRG